MCFCTLQLPTVARTKGTLNCQKSRRYWNLHKGKCRTVLTPAPDSFDAFKPLGHRPKPCKVLKNLAQNFTFVYCFIKTHFFPSFNALLVIERFGMARDVYQKYCKF